MSYRIKGCGCDCATMPENPCEPCGGAFQLQVSTRGGLASLCGDPEFATPSLPPKAYRTVTLSGTLVTQHWPSGDCTGASDYTETVVASGACVYHASTCVKTSGGQIAITGGPLNGTVTPTCDPTGYLGGSGVITTTRTTKRVEPPDYGVCRADFLGSSKFVSGSLLVTLSTEDTEEDAIARSAAAWSPWQQLAPPSITCCTSHETRGAGDFSFLYTQGRYRIRSAGKVGTVVPVALTFRRGDGSTFLVVRQFFPTEPSFPASPDGDETGWEVFTITTAAGTETCLIDARIYRP